MKSLTIGKKTFLLALVVSLAGLFAVSVPMVYYQLRAFDETYRTELQTVTQIAAVNLAPFLDFDEGEDAGRILENLLVQRDIRSAVLYDKKGHLFAKVGDPHAETAAPNPMPTTPLLTSSGDFRKVIHPIDWKGGQRGILVVTGDYAVARGKVIARLWQSVFSFGALSCLFAIGVGAWLQRFVSRPVKNLAAVAQQIRESADYSVRACRETHDEVGALTEAFNGMLERIAMQEAALKEARSALEVKVQALAGSEARVRGIIESLAEALILITPDGEVILANPRVSPVIGWEPAQLIGKHAVNQLFPESERLRAMELIHSAQTGSVCSAEMEIVSAHNERRPVEIHWSCLRDEQSAIVGVLAAFMDITDRQRAAADLAEVNARLVEASRRAGMAEIATNVLHNVGNAFNSVNVGVTVVTEKLLASKIPRLRIAANLLNSHGPSLPKWLSEDERGKHFAPYLDNLTKAMEAEQAATLSELLRLGEHIEHIKQIITTQQAYAKTSGVTERFSVRQIVEKCIAMEISALTHSAIQLEQEIPAGLDVVADRHKTLQILANLVRNARDAILDAQHGNGIIKITAVPNCDRVLIRVTDNGSGIAPEHLTKIFAHGFTTRADGHGFGLHGSALAAMEMKGSLTAGSPGKGAGATFTLALPSAA